jgi:hypothetical protein
MQYNSEQEKKDRVLKSLAIAGFVGLIIVISWLGIKFVNVLPSAFSSLASLADTVYRYEPVGDLTVVADKVRVNVDELVTITWEAEKRAGSYSFSYACAEGVTVDMRDQTGIRSLNCDTHYNVGDVTSLSLLANSEKNRFADIAYTISFIPSGKDTPANTGTGRITVTNPKISVVVVTPESPITTPEEPAEPTTPTVPTTPATSTPTTPTKPTTPSVPTTPVYVEVPVYGIPVSNPNGYTDLAATFLGSGVLKSNTFVATGVITSNAEKGAIQFAVQNIGTKTSSEWTYTAVLPNGTKYTSPKQLALKPNERAVITLGFSVPTTGLKSYNVAVSVSNDSKTSNNSFTSAIAVIK